MRQLSAKDELTFLHSYRVTKIALSFASFLKLADEKKRELQFGALIHDIGKLHVPAHILIKKGNLSEEEFAEIKKHPLFGIHILQNYHVSPEIDEKTKCFYNKRERGISSVGRASCWQREGHRFEPGMLHKKTLAMQGFFTPLLILPPERCDVHSLGHAYVRSLFGWLHRTHQSKPIVHGNKHEYHLGKKQFVSHDSYPLTIPPFVYIVCFYGEKYVRNRPISSTMIKTGGKINEMV